MTSMKKQSFAWSLVARIPALGSALLVGCSGGVDPGDPETDYGETRQTITGGTNVPTGGAPWEAVITTAGQSGAPCFGALVVTDDGVHADYVLTAAACVLTPDGSGGFSLPAPNSLSVTLGDRDHAIPEATEQTFGVSIVSVHPFVNPYLGKNDIAVLRLSRPPVTTSLVAPISFPRERLPIGGAATVTGWPTQVASPDPLRQATLPVVSNALCSPALASGLCAGYPDGHASAGLDLGAPLSVATSLGTVLGGLSTLGGSAKYSAFADVRLLMPWVSSAVGASTPSCAGETRRGATTWVQYNASTVYTDVDTSACGVTNGVVPQYFTELGGDSLTSDVTGPTSIYTPTSTGFRVYVVRSGITPATASAANWTIAWRRLRDAAPTAQAQCTGQTTQGATSWVAYDGYTVYTDVDTHACGYTATPHYFASLGGATGQYLVSGVSSIYTPTPTGFRVYLTRGAPFTPAQANGWGWVVNWFATPAGIVQSNECTAPSTTAIDTWVQNGSTEIYADVNTSACGFHVTPLYFTALRGSSSHNAVTGATSVWTPTATGFRVYLHQAGLTTAFAQTKKWAIDWAAFP
jgi:hypothetical protein